MPSESTSFKLIKAGFLIDGFSDKPIENGAVLIEDAKIVQAGSASEVLPPEGVSVEKYDFPRGTVLPGLIDVHTHFNYMGDGRHTDDVMAMEDDILLIRSVANARTHLESGVTTVRDCGGKHRTILSVREGMRRGLIPSPRILACGRPLTITGGHMWQMGGEADGIDEVTKAVRQVIKEGADYIKVPTTGGSTSTTAPFLPSYNLPELQAIVDEAHKFGKQVATHSRATSGIVNSLDAGVDMIIHSWMQEVDGSWVFRDDLAERIAREGRSINPTLYVDQTRIMVMREWEREGSTGQHAIVDGVATLTLDKAQRDFDSLMGQMSRYIDMGVQLIAGTDSGFEWYAFGNLMKELEYFSHVGMSYMATIKSATGDAAKAIGISDLAGTLKPDKVADVLVVDGNPIEKIGDLANVEAVFFEGARVR